MRQHLRRSLLSAAGLGGVIAGLVAIPSATAMSQCKPIAYVDNPHVTSNYASSHGYWKTGNCTPQYATVGAVLEEFWISKNEWVNMNTNQGTVWPGGGSGRNVPVNATCKAFQDRKWRSQATVILQDGSTNTSAWNEQTIACWG